ncbi:hypothetical protein ACEWY4_015244 [Coilia grayii]|uniref:Ig-like domain-containing protein n=1 Tax=Coilia grayii TaxID=363190 RepID=A0ABD1JNU9_9TELE
MKCFVFLTFILTAAEGFQLHGSFTPIAAELEGSVLLPCAAETPLPLEELEVEWRKSDSGALVHLFQDGDERPESQDRVYAERAHFFTKELVRGNYSIILHNVTMQDAGGFMCKVYTHTESSNITAEVYFERLVVTGAGVVFGYAAEEVVLSCSVDSHIPPEKLEEVAWKRKDHMLVLLYQDGEILSDSSHERYRGRVEFFTTEILKGNFSLRLKDVSTEDKGEYICEAFSGDLSANTTVVLQELGFSNLHWTILVLCSITLLYTFGFTVGLAWLRLQKKDGSQLARDIHFSRFLCPDILLGISFILWGVAEGSLGEAATCSTVNFVRFLLLLKTAPYLDRLPESFQRLKTLSAPAVHSLVTIVVLSVYHRTQQIFLAHLNTDTVSVTVSWYLIFSLALLSCIGAFLVGFCKNIGHLNVLHGVSSLFIVILLLMQSSSSQIVLFILPCFILVDAFLSCSMATLNCLKRIRLGYVLWITLVVTGLIFKCVIILYPTRVALEKSEDCVGFVSVMVLLLLLSSLPFWKHPQNTPEVPHAIVYMLGASGLSVVNSIALMTELTLKSMTGERNVPDLRVIVCLAESLFVLGWMSLTLHCICAMVQALPTRGYKILPESDVNDNVNDNCRHRFLVSNLRWWLFLL